MGGFAYVTHAGYFNFGIRGSGFMSPLKHFDYAFYLTVSGVSLVLISTCFFQYVINNLKKSQQSDNPAEFNDSSLPPTSHDDISRPAHDDRSWPAYDDRSRPAYDDRCPTPTVHYDETGISFSPYTSRY